MSISNGFKGSDIPVVVSDATSSKYRFMQGDTTDTSNVSLVVKAATGETTPPLGISQQPTTAADQPSTMRVYGIGKLTVNGNSINIDIGDQLTPTTGGLGVKVSTTDATPQYVGAIALEPSTADSENILVKIVGPYPIVKGTA